MTEQQSPKRLKKEEEKAIIQTLRSGNNRAILEALKLIRDSGNPALLQEIIDLFSRTEDPEIVQVCTTLLNDLKQQESAGILAEALKNEHNSPILEALTSACWQNGLDFSEYLDTFIELMKRSGYMVAVESQTVIEGNLSQIDDKKRMDMKVKLERSKDSAAAENLPLIDQLIEIIDQFPA